MKEKDAENIAVGDIYYKQSKYNCKSCFKVQIVEILNDKEVMVKGMIKSKKRKKEAKPFRTYISTLHKSPGKAVGGYNGYSCAAEPPVRCGESHQSGL